MTFDDRLKSRRSTLLEDIARGEMPLHRVAMHAFIEDNSGGRGGIIEADVLNDMSTAELELAFAEHVKAVQTRLANMLTAQENYRVTASGLETRAPRSAPQVHTTEISSRLRREADELNADIADLRDSVLQYKTMTAAEWRAKEVRSSNAWQGLLDLA